MSNETTTKLGPVNSPSDLTVLRVA